MVNAEQKIESILAVANITAAVKGTLDKVGLEYITPLDQDIQEEKILKMINLICKEQEEIKDA